MSNNYHLIVTRASNYQGDVSDQAILRPLVPQVNSSSLLPGVVVTKVLAAVYALGCLHHLAAANKCGLRPAWWRRSRRQTSGARSEHREVCLEIRGVLRATDMDMRPAALGHADMRQLPVGEGC